MNIINLAYPMFETTEKEKQLLRKVEISLILDPENSMHNILCDLEEIEAFILLRKTYSALNGSVTLMYYFYKKLSAHFPLNQRICTLLYKVWINKLLNYSPNN